MLIQNRDSATLRLAQERGAFLVCSANTYETTLLPLSRASIGRAVFYHETDRQAPSFTSPKRAHPSRSPSQSG